jgi:predicted ester cyclase
MDLVPRGINPLSDIHHSATGFDRVEHAGNSKNMGTREPGGHHAPGPILIDSSRRPMQTTNRQFMTRFLEFINTADPRLATELVSPDAVFHVPGRAEPVQGCGADFPTFSGTLEETVIEGDVIAARFTMRGTHRGAFFGVPPTGKTIAVQALNIYRLSTGKIISEVGQPDLLGLMQQIGGLPRS